METDNSNDLNIVQGSTLSSIADGDVPALDLLYRKFKKPVFLLALSILNDYDLAEDVMQETFLKVREKAADCRGGTNPKAWIITIAHNLSISILRKRSHETCNIDTLEGVTAEAEQKMEGMLGLHKVLEQLDEPERSIVTYRVLVGLRHKEIARIVGLSPADVRMRYSLALKKLKKYFKQSE
jgi:RNA polymerase sigma factor (sigma-70 family)